jgi:hypothetical protein
MSDHLPTFVTEDLLHDFDMNEGGSVVQQQEMGDNKHDKVDSSRFQTPLSNEAFAKKSPHVWTELC